MAEAQVKYQQATYERYKALIAKKLIAQSDFDLAEYNYLNSQASLKNAKSVYDKNRINLSYAGIYSPIDGIILNRAVARSLVNDPVVIMADEATGNLDSRTSYEIMELFQRLNSDEGKTIVFVTHEPDIARLTSRNIIFRDGWVTKEQIVTDRVLASEMLKALPQVEMEA